MPNVIIPIIISTPHSAGPAIFQAVGILVIVLWMVLRDLWDEDKRLGRHTDGLSETQIRSKAVSEAEAHYAKQATRFENRSIDADAVVLWAAVSFALIGVITALACMWSAAQP